MENDEQWSGTFDIPDRFVFLFGVFPLAVLLYVLLSVFCASLVVEVIRMWSLIFFIDVLL
jgi:hypothetical protein